MNEECKYCSYLKKCPDIVNHNSVYCICHKRIPKNRNMSYEQLQNNWNKLKEWLEEQGQRYKNEEEKAYPYFYVWKQMQKLEGDVK